MIANASWAASWDLEVWETYRQRVNERRRAVEAEILGLDGRMQEINAELGEEDDRTERLGIHCRLSLNSLAKARKTQEQLLEQARKVEASLIEQRKLVDMLARQLESAQLRHTELSQPPDRPNPGKGGVHASGWRELQEIESAYNAWQAQRAELERWEEVAARFREHDARRQPPLLEIEARKRPADQGIGTAH